MELFIEVVGWLARVAHPHRLRLAVSRQADGKIGGVSGHERLRRDRLRDQHGVSTARLPSAVLNVIWVGIGVVALDSHDRRERTRSRMNLESAGSARCCYSVTSPLFAAPLQDGPYVVAARRTAPGSSRWVEGDDRAPQVRDAAVRVGGEVAVQGGRRRCRRSTSSCEHPPRRRPTK